MLLSLLSSHPATQMAMPIMSVLTALAAHGEAALQIRKANGVFLLGQLLLHDAADEAHGADSRSNSFKEAPLAARPQPVVATRPRLRRTRTRPTPHRRARASAAHIEGTTCD